MKAEHRYFDITPRIVRADCETAITIAPLFDPGRFSADKEYELSYFPVEEFAERSGWTPQNRTVLKPANGTFRFVQYFEAEQEHVLLLEEVLGTERKLIGDFRVYSLKPDLFCRRPYKGDFHLHSAASDGRESPAYVAGACRRIGLDFMAVTDHRKYAPSLEAQRAYADVDIDLRIFPGEEVHPPDNPVHIINFGGSASIQEMFRDEMAYREAVKRLARKLEDLPRGVDPYQYASSAWCFDRIREVGGLGVFCHPYWFTSHRYAPSGALTSWLFEKEPFDAFELIGGFHRAEADSNTLQVARYHEERVKGRTIAIVGASDAHGCERGDLFGWYYTIVFAPSVELGDLITSIKDLYSVAVEALPGETVRAYGPFRMVKYALFLIREVFPQHDELCFEEGRLMLRHIAGDPASAVMLGKLGGRVASLMNRHRGAVG